MKKDPMIINFLESIPAYDDWNPDWETPTSSLVRKHFFGEQHQQQQQHVNQIEKKNHFEFKEEEKIIELTPLQEMNSLLGFSESEMENNSFSDTSVVPIIKNEEEEEEEIVNDFQISELNDYLNEDIQFEDDMHSSDQTPSSTSTPENSGNFSDELSTLQSDPIQYEEFITLPNDLQTNDQESNQKSQIVETVVNGKIIKKKPGRKPQVLTAKQREEKGKLRQMKNREAAKRCREKKSLYLEDLEVQLEALKKENQELKQRLQNLENPQTQTQ